VKLMMPRPGLCLSHVVVVSDGRSCHRSSTKVSGARCGLGMVDSLWSEVALAPCRMPLIAMPDPVSGRLCSDPRSSCVADGLRGPSAAACIWAENACGLVGRGACRPQAAMAPSQRGDCVRKSAPRRHCFGLAGAGTPQCGVALRAHKPLERCGGHCQGKVGPESALAGEGTGQARWGREAPLKLRDHSRWAGWLARRYPGLFIGQADLQTTVTIAPEPDAHHILG
jgi:hypothetical protein